MNVSRPLYEALSHVGAPQQLTEVGAAAEACPRLVNNTHIHLPPNFSAFESVEQAVRLAAEQGVGVLGVSNYYHFGVYADFSRLARQAGIFPLFGTEIICLVDQLVRAGRRINDPGNPGKMYICGKGVTRFDPLPADAAELLQAIRDTDSRRMADMVAKMGQVLAQAGFDAGVDEVSVKAMVVARHGSPPESVYLQERHIVQAFQEELSRRLTPSEQAEVLTRAYGAAPAVSVEDPVATQNEMRSRLMKAGRPGYVPETFVGLEHARRLILCLGGIPCYPVLADGVTPRCEFESTPAELVEQMHELGLHCAEFIPDRNSPEVLREYVLAMRDAGIVVTAGTEHNTRTLIPIPPACKGGAPLPADVAEAFWEGACVVAAHEFLACHGEEGFVSRTGAPNQAYADARSRIAAFSALGCAAIAAYRRFA